MMVLHPLMEVLHPVCLPGPRVGGGEAEQRPGTQRDYGDAEEEQEQRRARKEGIRGQEGARATTSVDQHVSSSTCSAPLNPRLPLPHVASPPTLGRHMLLPATRMPCFALLHASSPSS
mmetsp:Transcript_71787/g.149938  ORF Transcript_71787/g.149938 Transcript_71787/m.149938 type:complete len:118 (-) Transcript_71787:229-582(-)